jgi:hypothetical protein
VGDRSRGRFATPADSPLHDQSPYQGLHVRRGSLGFAPCSRTIFCPPVPNLSVTIRNCCIAVRPRRPRSRREAVELVGLGLVSPARTFAPESPDGVVQDKEKAS